MPPFRPEPIAIPAGSFGINPSLELPVSISGACYDGAVSSEATDGGASSSCLGTSSSTVATSIIEPLEQADLAFGVSEIHHADLKVLHNIGHGSSGVVQKVLHTPSDSVLALKIIPVEADETKRKQILLELKTLHESMHECIVSFYGAFFREGAVHVCLEYMDASLLDVARSEGCALPEPVRRRVLARFAV
jgi:mitogen-activated protein kinase kinase